MKKHELRCIHDWMQINKERLTNDYKDLAGLSFTFAVISGVLHADEPCLDRSIACDAVKDAMAHVHKMAWHAAHKGGYDGPSLSISGKAQRLALGS